MPPDPFRALGLDADPGLTDDQIRAAWHRVAAATHPDRADGGDPAAFTAAAAAYSDLRSPFGRGEALADLAGRPAARRPARPAAGAAASRAWHGAWSRAARRARSHPGRRAWSRAARVRGGRPGRLAGLVLGGAAVSVLAVIIDGWQPASLALIVGAATWVLRGAHRNLGARPLAGDGAAPARDAADSCRAGR